MRQKTETKKPIAEAKPAKLSLSSWQLFFWVVVPITAITFISFSPALKNTFSNWDDGAYVFENIHIGDPFPEAVKYFFGPHYFIGNYVPLTMCVYALEYQVAGFEPEVFHTLNVLLHLANVMLVFGFIFLLSGRKPLVAGLVALFFGIHPMHVESVAWIAELKDVLYSAFFLAALLAYCKYQERQAGRLNPEQKSDLNVSKQSPSNKPGVFKFLVAAFVLFVLSVLSKPAAVALPVVLLLVDFYTRRRFDKWVWIEKLPFFAVSVIIGMITLAAQQADRLMHDYHSFTQRVFCACYSFLVYLLKLILPVRLSIFYPYPSLVDGRLPYVYYIAPVIVILLFYGAYRTLRRTRVVVFGLLFFLANMILVLQLVSEGDAMMADHYTYISYIGLFFIIAMCLDRLYHSSTQKLAAYKPIAITTMAVFALTCSCLTYARCKVWQNPDTMANDLLSKFPDDPLALNNRGFVSYSMGKREESVNFFVQAIQLKPGYMMAYINLINSYLELKDYDNGSTVTDTALTYEPHNYLLLNKKGHILFARGKYSEALECFKASLRSKPDYATAAENVSICYQAIEKAKTQSGKSGN